MSSLLAVAKAMNAEAANGSSMLSLADVAKAEKAKGLSKPTTLMDVAKQETQHREVPKQTLQQLAQEIDKEDQSRIQVVLESTAKEVKEERQELRSQKLKQAATEVQQEEQQAVELLSAKVASVNNSKEEMANSDNEKNDDADGYSSFEEEDDSTPKKLPTRKHNEPVDDEPAEEEETYDPPPRTTPSESKESKAFLRAVYRADKYQVRDMLDDGVVDANTADQHGWSGLHWAASQNHVEILQLLVQKGAEVNAIDQLNGWTALHVAVVRESVSCVKLLLASGTEARIKDKYGDTVSDCLQAASRKKKLQMLQLLQQQVKKQ